MMVIGPMCNSQFSIRQSRTGLLKVHRPHLIRRWRATATPRPLPAHQIRPPHLDTHPPVQPNRRHLLAPYRLHLSQQRPPPPPINLPPLPPPYLPHPPLSPPPLLPPPPTPPPPPHHPPPHPPP